METVASRQDHDIGLPAREAKVALYSPAGGTDGRRQALLRSFSLVRHAQEVEADPTAAIVKLIDDAESQGWGDVVLGGLFAACVQEMENGDEASTLEAIERLIVRAEAEADRAMVALALALRARLAAASRDSARSVSADADLARATVILESGDGGPLQRATAHNSCAIVYGQRRLWELEDQQYAAAEALLPDCQDSPLPSTVLFNRAELHVDWACAMREIGDTEGVKMHCRVGAEVLAGAEHLVSMPPSWRHELRVGDALLAAVGGADVADRARAMLAEILPGTEEWTGYLHLAIALSPGPLDVAAEAAERAIACIDPGLSQTEYDLALRVAAELEAAAPPGNGRSAGLRCIQRQTELRQGSRLSTLAAMEALLQSERLLTEHDRLSRHAHLDDLTGLANRRGLQRYLTGLQRRETQQVAVLIVDIDNFKQVNDRYGHGAGDDTLIRLAAILTSNIRPDDMAVRLGGDEFALVLADTDLVVAVHRADAIVAAMTAKTNLAMGIGVTVSVGLAAGHPDQIDQVIAHADAAMYQAKAAGGSQTVSG